MDNQIELQVVRHEEKLVHQQEDISDLKGIVESLVISSRNQAHTVDQLIAKAQDEKISDRLKVLEQAFDRIVFMGKVLFSIATTPALLYIAYEVIVYLKTIPQ